MSETNELPVPLPGEDESALVGARPEESREWVVNTYRKHQRVLTSNWIDQMLGEGRRDKTYIPPVLLDTNPIRHRQSIQEQVFPAPRIIHEDLLMTDHMKIMLEADCGMGKTVFLKYYQERLLDQTPHPVYPLPVYFNLGFLPEGTGITQFMESVHREILDVVLTEAQEDTELDLDEELLLVTVKALEREGRILFLLDSLDQLPAEDRFQVYLETFVEDKTFRSNRLILATRKFSFGPLATDSIIQRGKDAAFHIAFERIGERERGIFLGAAQKNKELENLGRYSPELMEVPLILKMLRALSDCKKLDDLKSRGKIYSAYFEHLLEEVSPKKEKESAWNAITIGIKASIGSISAGLSKLFDEDTEGLTEKQINFLRKQKNKGGLVNRINFADAGIVDSGPLSLEFEDDYVNYIKYSAERVGAPYNPKLLEDTAAFDDTIYLGESSRGANPDIKMNGPYQISAGARETALGGLKDFHIQGKGINLSPEKFNYLQTKPINEMSDAAQRLLVHAHLNRVQLDEVGQGDDIAYNLYGGNLETAWKAAYLGLHARVENPEEYQQITKTNIEKNLQRMGKNILDYLKIRDKKLDTNVSSVTRRLESIGLNPQKAPD